MPWLCKIEMDACGGRNLGTVSWIFRLTIKRIPFIKIRRCHDSHLRKDPLYTWKDGRYIETLVVICPIIKRPEIAKFMGPTWGPPGSCRPQVGPMLAPWTLLSGSLCLHILIKETLLQPPSLRAWYGAPFVGAKFNPDHPCYCEWYTIACCRTCCSGTKLHWFYVSWFETTLDY